MILQVSMAAIYPIMVFVLMVFDNTNYNNLLGVPPEDVDRLQSAKRRV